MRAGKKVITNLGEMSDQEVENHKLAFKASRQGKSLMLPDAPDWRARVLANLAYLDIAVAYEMWRSWKLSELLHRLIPERKVAIGAAEVVCALPLQGGSGKGVVVVQIPQRPFLLPAFKRFQKGVQKRFLGRAAGLMGMAAGLGKSGGEL